MGLTTETAAPLGQGFPRTVNREGWWQAAALILLLGWLYSAILFHLVKQWAGDPNFSHGFFVPIFSLYVLWQDRAKLARIPRAPSSWGLAILSVGLAVLVVGVLGAELFLSRISLLLVIAGLVVGFYGWRYFRAILFPWAFLVLMVPIPAIIFSQITFPLQLLASQFAASVLRLLGVPVLREGNILNLPAMPLDVAEACSGIRSLLSLTTLAIIYGYLMETRISIRIVLALASIPIAIFANGLRIVGTGLLVQYWDADKANGFFHEFQGWLIFLVSLTLLFLLHQLLRIGRRGVLTATATPAVTRPQSRTAASNLLVRFAVAAALLSGTALLLHARNYEVVEASEPLQSFPYHLGSSLGSDIEIPRDVLDILGPGQFLLRDYRDQADQNPDVNLYIQYFPTQMAGDTIHSPKHCLPGNGWAWEDRSRTIISVPGHAPFSASRAVITKGDERQLVIYWYWAHDRAVASEYAAKYYLVADSIRMHRSDGSLFRILTALQPNETEDAAQQRLFSFAGEIVPLIDQYVPR